LRATRRKGKDNLKRESLILLVHGCCFRESNKGPFMGEIGSIMFSAEQIAESIFETNASISKGFSTCDERQ